MRWISLNRLNKQRRTEALLRQQHDDGEIGSERERGSFVDRQRRQEQQQQHQQQPRQRLQRQEEEEDCSARLRAPYLGWVRD